MKTDLMVIGGGWGGFGTDSHGLGFRPLAGSCECSDEPSSSGDTEFVC
jgi:hypothetical protein